MLNACHVVGIDGPYDSNSVCYWVVLIVLDVYEIDERIGMRKIS